MNKMSIKRKLSIFKNLLRKPIIKVPNIRPGVPSFIVIIRKYYLQSLYYNISANFFAYYFDFYILFLKKKKIFFDKTTIKILLRIIISIVCNKIILY